MEEPFHITLDGFQINPSYLKSVVVIGDYIERACQELGLTPTNSFTIEKFSGGGEGVTATQILSESLLSIHTYPEHKTIYIDIFSCKRFDTAKAIQFTQEFFFSKSFFMTKVRRLNLREIQSYG